MRVAVLGVGLIGGSIGLAARGRAGAHVVGYDPDAGALSSAVELGAIDEPAFGIADAVSDANVVFIAAPVGVAVGIARTAFDAAGTECVISDVGSTKRQIVRAITDPRFVGGHPLAGAETAGVEHAREDLFDGATWYLTPASGAPMLASGALTPATGALSPAAGAPPPAAQAPATAIERLRALIERFGARPVTIDPDDHDHLMASVSHLPHVLANVLVAQAARVLASEDLAVEDGRLDAGPSFRDATRVAGANTAIWTDIYMSNRDALVAAIDEAVDRLREVRKTLEDGDSDGLAAWNEQARSAREKLRRAGLAPGS
jgi:prephenate dehydrogenase